MDEWITRQTIIERAKDPSDEKAWDDFVKYYEGYIRIVLRKILFDCSDIDDITQEIMVKIWKYLSKFEPNSERAQFRRWLSVLIRNHAMDYIDSDKRYQNRKNKVSTDFDLYNETAPSELDQVIQAEWKRHVSKTAFDNITPLFSGNAIEAFRMQLTGKSTKEIAQDLDIKENSVYTLANRVRLRLSNEVKHLREIWEIE